MEEGQMFGESQNREPQQSLFGGRGTWLRSDC